MANEFITPEQFLERALTVGAQRIPEFDQIFSSNKKWCTMSKENKAKGIIIMSLGGVLVGINDEKD